MRVVFNTIKKELIKVQSMKYYTIQDDLELNKQELGGYWFVGGLGYIGEESIEREGELGLKVKLVVA